MTSLRRPLLLSLLLSLGACIGCASPPPAPTDAGSAPPDAPSDTAMAPDGGGCGFELLDTPPLPGRVVSSPVSVPPRIVGTWPSGFAVLRATADGAALHLIPSSGDWSAAEAIPAGWAASPDGAADVALEATDLDVFAAVAGFDAVRWARWSGRGWVEVGSAPLPQPGRLVDDLALRGGLVATISHAATLPADPARYDDVFFRAVDPRTGATNDLVIPEGGRLGETARLALDGFGPVIAAHDASGATLRFGMAPPTHLDGCGDPLSLRLAGSTAWIACGALRVFALESGTAPAPLWREEGPTPTDPWFSDVLALADGTALVATFADDHRIDLLHLGSDGALLARTSIDLGYGRLNHPVELAASPDGTLAVMWSRWGTGDVVRFRLSPCP
jgi:hypothetical protein